MTIMIWGILVAVGTQVILMIIILDRFSSIENKLIITIKSLHAIKPNRSTNDEL